MVEWTPHRGWNFDLKVGTGTAGVVLIHEIFGFDDYIDSVATKIQEAGFSAAAVDLYRGTRVRTIEDAQRIKKTVRPETVLDAIAAGQELLAQKMPKGSRIGSMGFGMGGGFALLGACDLPLDFCIDYYGQIDSPEDLRGLRGPLLLLLASEDDRVTPWAFEKLVPAARREEKRLLIHLYPNTQHAFHRPDWDGHDPKAAKDAWFRTVSFLSEFSPPR
jgi:carboxymethylenebutenolidase